MPTQIQVRGAVEATQGIRTLASRELDVNTTDLRLSVHNGSTAGGIPHINYSDFQNQEYVYAAASGTNAITITLPIAPSAYAIGQRFTFKAANSITGSATLNVNSLGAKTIKKVSDGSLVTLSANDIITDQMVTVLYDGVDFQVVSGGSSISTGTWTPILNFVTVSYTSRTANYVKIGNFVYCYYQIVFTGLDTSDTSPIAVSGVPFTITDYSVNGNGFEVGAGVARLICGSEDTSRVRFYKSNDTSGYSTQVRYNEFFSNVNGTFEGNFCYITS